MSNYTCIHNWSNIKRTLKHKSDCCTYSFPKGTIFKSPSWVTGSPSWVRDSSYWFSPDEWAWRKFRLLLGTSSNDWGWIGKQYGDSAGDGDGLWSAWDDSKFFFNFCGGCEEEGGNAEGFLDTCEVTRAHDFVGLGCESLVLCVLNLSLLTDFCTLIDRFFYFF